MPRESFERGPIEPFVHEQLPQRIVFGWGGLKELSAELDRLSAQRVLLLSGGSMISVAEGVQADIGTQAVGLIPRVRLHVPHEDVASAVAGAKEVSADVLVTLGGGSAIGLGKALAVAIEIPLVAIPTTYSGSEVTPIYGTMKDGRKRTGRDERALPRVVIYDPALSASLPSRATASTGMNALAHCVEALYGERSNPLTDLLAEKAIRVLRSSLPVCIEDPADRGGRTQALYGAYLAGTVLATAGMAVHHRICHVLGGTFGLPHGEVNAIVLPHAVAFNEPAAPDAVRRVADALGAESAAPALFDLAQSLGAPTSLREIGIREADLAKATSLVVEGDSYNPRPVDFDGVYAILEDAFTGKRPT